MVFLFPSCGICESFALEKTLRYPIPLRSCWHLARLEGGTLAAFEASLRNDKGPGVGGWNWWGGWHVNPVDF